MIAIINYEAGNLTSVERAVRSLGAPCKITQSQEEIASAERVIFPGVGAAGSAVRSLRELGLDKALANALEAGKPVMGICLGTQIIFEASQEDDARCLGLLPGRTVRFADGLAEEDGRAVKIPHMGWNNIDIARPHPVLRGIDPRSEFYFVHSYHPAPAQAADILATTYYGYEFASVVARDNLVATQFHPEKSGRPGLQILDNFLAWNPEEDGHAV